MEELNKLKLSQLYDIVRNYSENLDILYIKRHRKAELIKEIIRIY